MDILVIGDTCIDEFIKISDASVVCDIQKEHCKLCIDYSDKIPVEEYSATPAGNSNNVGIGTAKLGLKTGIYCEMGNDPNADIIINGYKKLGVNTKFCIKNKGAPTNVHQIIVFKGERTILSYHHPYEYKVRKWEKPKWLYYSSLPENFENFQKDLVKYLKANPDIGVGFNPGTFHLRAGLEKLRDILEVTHILFVNMEETRRLVDTKNKSLEEIHKELLKLGPKLTVLTEGAKGSSSYDGKKLVTLGLLVEKDMKPRDKTGAGDAHSAGFIAAIHYKRNHLEALKWGTINAAGEVKEVGSTNGQRTKNEIEEILAKGAQFTKYGSDT